MHDAPRPLHQVLAATARAHGARTGFVGQGEQRTWEALHDGARDMARALLHVGVRHGEHVGILLGNSALWLETFFACGLIGAVAVPVNTRFKADELAFCLRQADIAVLVYADRFLGIDFGALLAEVEPALAQGLPGRALPVLRQAVCVGADAPPAGAVPLSAFLAAGRAVDDAALAARQVQVRPDDVLLIQYTSGTTSFPKGVMLSHANMLLNAQAVARRIGVTAEDRYFSIRPFFHVAGSTLSILVALQTGCCLLTLPRFDVAETLRVLADARCTLISGNDSIFLMLMGHADFRPEALHLRGGWAAAGPEVMRQIRDVMRVPHICNAYGQSEASPNVLLSAWDDPFALRAEGLGLPHPGIEVRIADPASDAELPVGAQGEIQVRGWNVMRGYYKLPEQTSKAFSADGWLKTGDLGEARADGRVKMVGRLKDLYRVGGENVAPAEVEEVLHSHPAVQQAQVIGVPDARLGEVTGAFVQLKAGRQATAGELIDWCKTRCANFKVPRYLDIVDTFEHIGMTGSAKVQKNKLRDHALRRWGLDGQAPQGERS